MSRPTTPLRRVSTGSLSASYKALNPNAASNQTPLSFLQDALVDLSDETSVLQSNLEAIGGIGEALGTFNEAFAMYLYGLKMNAFCVEWPEAPADENFERAGQRSAQHQANQAAQAQLYPYSSGASSSIPSHAAAQLHSHIGDQTYATQDDDASFGPPTPKVTRGAAGAKAATSTLKPALKKPSAGAASAAGPKTAAAKKISPALKKKREGIAAGIIDTLPLEYRGADPKPRALAEGVIMALLAAGHQGARIADMVKMPDMSQAKVNKTLIALVAAKHVVKTSNNGIVYSLDSSKHTLV